MNHCTTASTFDRILRLENERRQLLDKDEWLTPDEQARFREIRAALDRLWESEREERVLAVCGPPRLISDNRPESYTRRLAHGIAPLTKGDRL